MKTPEALDIVLKLAKLGAQVEEDEGVQSDIDGTNNYEAIKEVELFSKSYDTSGGFARWQVEEDAFWDGI